MKSWRMLLPGVALIAALAPLQSVSPAAADNSGQQVALGAMLSPDATLSTSGDFATDTFGNPWDFSDEQDVIPISGVGAFQSDAPSVSGGILSVQTHDAAEIRLL